MNGTPDIVWVVAGAICTAVMLAALVVWGLVEAAAHRRAAPPRRSFPDVPAPRPGDPPAPGA